MSPENRPSIRKKILYGAAGAIMYAGGIGAAVTGGYDSLFVQAPKYAEYSKAVNHPIEILLPDGSVTTIPIPRKPDTKRNIVDVIGIASGLFLVLNGYPLIDKNLLESDKEE